MADYTPPIENLPIFDKSVFIQDNTALTIADADNRYLRFPNAQGTENLQEINVAGVATFYSRAVVSTNLGATSNVSFKVVDTSGRGIDFIPNTLNDTYDNIVQTNDSVISSIGNAPLVLTNSSGTNTNGLRLENGQIVVGYGGSADVPTNRMTFTPTTVELDGTVINFNNNVIMNSGTATSRQFTASYVNISDVNSTSTSLGSRIFNLGGITYLEKFGNSGAFHIATYNSSGVFTNNIQINSISSDFKNVINLNSTTPANRTINNSVYNITDNTLTTPTQRGQIFINGSTMAINNINTDFTDTTINFGNRIASASSTSLSIGSNINANRSIVMSTATTNISQAGILTDTNENIFKVSSFRTNVGQSAIPVLDFYDIITGRGFRFVNDCTTGGYNTLTTAGDTVMTQRYRPSPTSSIGLNICLVDSNSTCIRLGSENSGWGRIQMRAGATNSITINDANSGGAFANSTTFNQAINMVGTTGASRSISNVGQIGLYDLDGVSGTFGLFLQSTNQQIQYVSYTNNYYHTFFTTSAGVSTARFSVANGNVSTIGIPFHIRSSTTTTRFEVECDTGGIADLFSNNSSSLNSSLRVRLRNSANSIITPLTITPTLFELNVPTRTTTVNPSDPNDNGFSTAINLTSNNISSSSTITNLNSITIGAVGTYVICIARYVYNNDGTNRLVMSEIDTGLNEFNNQLSQTGLLAASRLKSYGHNNGYLDIPAGGFYTDSATCIYKTYSANKTLYYNGFITYTGSTAVDLRYTISYTKIY